MSLAKRKVKLWPRWPNSPSANITFFITLRRNTLFYSINIKMPIMTISLLTLLVFHHMSLWKRTWSISIFLTLTVFSLCCLTFTHSPPWSMFTMIVLTSSICFFLRSLHWAYTSGYHRPKIYHIGNNGYLRKFFLKF